MRKRIKEWHLHCIYVYILTYNIRIFISNNFYVLSPPGLALIALYLFLFILCAPPMFIQLKLGGYAQRGIVGLLSHYLPIAKGLLLSHHLPIAKFRWVYFYIACITVWSNSKLAYEHSISLVPCLIFLCCYLSQARHN